MDWSELKETVKMCPICGERPGGLVYTSNPPKYGYSHCGIHGGYNNSWIEAEEKWNEQVYLYQQKQNKLTDEQIIKALECCTNEHLGCEDGCPYADVGCYDEDGFHTIPMKDALDLIKRQKAEIERLEKHVQTIVKMKRCIDLKKQVEESAINRLAEKLKEYYPSIAKGVDYTVEEVLKD